MIQGKFSNQGELIFEIDLIASDGLIITVDALLDTGFIPFHQKYDADANPGTFAESQFLNFEFCGKLRGRVSRLEQTFQDEF
ncbi:MAG: hypothetical protein RMX68_023845 [Aulosira sp. ZfuVER01]